MAESLKYVSTLKCHRNWVTSIATFPANAGDPNSIISSSRDKTLVLWREGAGQSEEPFRALTGHNQAVSSVQLSTESSYALSSSWDKTMRLWDLNKCSTIRIFNGHTKEVESVAFSTDNRQIVSGSRDRTIKLWNTLAECKFTINAEVDSHTDWVSCVVFSPSAKLPLIVSGGWDKLVKVWSLTDCKLKANLVGHTGVVHTTAVSPDGSLCASGGKDGVAMLWDVQEGKHLYTLDAGGNINALCFSPSNYWLCAATDTSIKVWDLENKNILDELSSAQPTKSGLPWCVSLAWSSDGRKLYAGSTDGNIYKYVVGTVEYNQGY